MFKFNFHEKAIFNAPFYDLLYEKIFLFAYV